VVEFDRVKDLHGTSIAPLPEVNGRRAAAQRHVGSNSSTGA
jgi:hypothetical protein